MIDPLLATVLLVGIATLAATIGTLRSSRRSEDLGEDRYELLRDQQDRLKLLHEERQMLIERLERESRERQQVIESLRETGRQPATARNQNAETAQRAEQRAQEQRRLAQELHSLQEDLERERREHLEAQRRIERLEQEHRELSVIRSEAKRSEQERKQLLENLREEREQHLSAQARVEDLEQERLRLKQELNRLEELDGQMPPAARDGNERAGVVERLWWRRPVTLIALILGLLIAWLTSLVVALNLLNLY
jgi:DNA repair exonuclease SbcCD ATPase subunit